MGLSQVRFTNSTATKIYVAYSRRDDNCRSICQDYGEGSWDVLGWINLDPGETETRANPTSYRFFYYYAEGADGRIYNGVYGPREVTNSIFQKCTCVRRPSYYPVGFRQLDTDRFGGVNFL
jgi:hypothetical protein